MDVLVRARGATTAQPVKMREDTERHTARMTATMGFFLGTTHRKYTRFLAKSKQKIFQHLCEKKSARQGVISTMSCLELESFKASPRRRIEVLFLHTLKDKLGCIDPREDYHGYSSAWEGPVACLIKMGNGGLLAANP